MKKLLGIAKKYMASKKKSKNAKGKDRWNFLSGDKEAHRLHRENLSLMEEAKKRRG